MIKNAEKEIDPKLKEFGERLNKQIAKLGVSKREFARRVKYSQGYIGSILKGKTQPGMFFLLDAARECNVTPEWLALGEYEQEIIEVHEPSLTEEEFEIIEIWRSIDHKDKQEAKSILKSCSNLKGTDALMHVVGIMSVFVNLLGKRLNHPT